MNTPKNHLSSLFRPLLIGLACLLPGLSARAQTTTWQGSTTAWGTSANWSSGLPATGIQTLFYAPATTSFTLSAGTVNRVVGGLEFLGTNAQSFAILIGDNTATTRSIRNEGNLLVDAGASGTFSILPADTAGARQLIWGPFTGAAGEYNYSILNNSTTASLVIGVTQSQGTTSTATATNLTYGGVGNIDVTAPIEVVSSTSRTVNLIKQGTGTLTLSGANTYNGTTTISEGVLQLGNGGAGGSISNSSNITNNATLAFNRSDSYNYSGVISGTGQVRQVGSGTTILSGANTYSGLTTISGGTLQIGNAGSNGSIASNVLIESGSLVFAKTGTTTYSGVISGTNGLFEKRNSGTLILTSANTFSGTTRIVSTANNNIRLANANALQNSTVEVAVTNGLRFETGTTTYTIGALAGGSDFVLQDSAGSAIALQAGNNNASTTYSGSISGPGSLVKIGSGTLTLSDSEPFSAGFAGDVTVASGTLNVTGGALATAGRLTLANDTTLGLSAGVASVTAGEVIFGTNTLLNITAYDASALGEVTLVTAGSAIDTSGVSLRFHGEAVTPSVDQYLALELTQSPDGRSLKLLSDLAWNSVAAAHGTFNIGTGSSFTTPQALADRNPASFTPVAGSNWDGRSLTKTGEGTLVLAQANTYTGATQVNGGTLRLGVTDAIATSSSVSVATGATLDLDGHDQSLHDLSGGGRIALGAATLTAVTSSGGSTFSGAIAGSGRLLKNGAGTLTLGGASSYSGGTTISTGKIVATDAAALGTGGVDVASGSTLEFNLGSSGTHTGAITGQGSLLKIGSGTLTLNAATGHVGTLAVDGGNLAVGNGAQALAFTADTAAVATGASLTVEKNSTLAVTGALALANGSTLNLVAGTASPIISADTVAIGATGTRLNVSGISGSSAMPFTLISTTAGITGDFASVGVGGSGSSSSDYLVVSAFKSGNNYVVNAQLAWDAANSAANGSFTLFDGTEFFTLGVGLGDRAANATTGWDGRSLTKAGAGTLELSAVNTYTGATNLAAGTLRLGTANAIASSAAVTVAQGARLDLGVSDQSMNNVSGAGAIALNGATLTAINTGSTELSGVISGTNGRLVKQGAGTLTLSGANTYTGGTTVSAGRLIATNTNALGTGTVVNNAALEFALIGAGSYAGVITGTGTLTKSGTGFLELLANSGAFSGSTTVQGGTLAVNGTLGGGMLVASGGRLQGTGTVGSTTIANGGKLSPGNSIGTLAVSGNLAFSTGSTYEVEINPTGASDRVDVSGTASIQSGASVNVTRLTGTYNYGTRYTILSAAGGVTGNFSTLTQNLPFIDLFFGQDANHVYLDVRRNTIAFDEYAQSPNQRATANAVEAMGQFNPLYIAVTETPDAATAQLAFDRLSGEMHASLQSAMVNEAFFVSGLTREHGRAWDAPADASGEKARSVGWVQALRSDVRTDAANGLHEARRRTTGIIGGVDWMFREEGRVGVLAGGTDGTFSSLGLGSEADVSAVHLAAYASRQYDRLSLRVGGGYSRQWMKTQRIAELPSTNVAFHPLTSSRNADVLQAFGEAGWLMQLGHAKLEPFANAAIAQLQSKAFAESGSDAALSGRKETREYPTTMLGIRAVHVLAGRTETPKVRLTGSIGWQHAYGSTATQQHLSFAGGEEFEVQGVPLSRDLYTAEAGVGINLTSAARFDLGYSGRLSSDYRDHTFRGLVTLAF